MVRCSWPGDPDKSALIRAVRYNGSIKMPPPGKAAGPPCSRRSPPGSRWARRGRIAPARQQRPPRRRVRDLRGAADALGLPTRAQAAAPRGQEYSVGPLAHRPVHPGEAGAEGAAPRAAGRQAHPAAPRDLRSDRPPAHHRRRSTPSSPTTRPTPLPASSTACSPRRATASGGAGTGWMSRATRIRRAMSFTKTPHYPIRLQLIGTTSFDAFNQRSALQPVHRAAVRRGPAARWAQDKRPLAAMGFLTVGRRFLNSQPDIIDDRIDVVCRGLMGLTSRLRALPQPQVRSDPHQGLLLALRRLRQLG